MAKRKKQKNLAQLKVEVNKTPKTRITWGFNPVTKTIPSKKRYSRKGKNKPSYE